MFNYKEKQKSNIRCQTNNVKGGIKLLAQQALWPIFEGIFKIIIPLTIICTLLNIILILSNDKTPK